MFITCNYVPEKNTTCLCMSSAHTTSPEQIINSRTRIIVKHQRPQRRQIHWQAWTKLHRARKRNDFWQSWTGGHKWWTVFISFLFHWAAREHLAIKNNNSKDWNCAGMQFNYPMRVELFTALSVLPASRWTSCSSMKMGRIGACPFSMSALLVRA